MKSADDHSPDTFEDILKKQGKLIWTCHGFSMRPLIHEKKDVIVLETITRPPRPWDVVLYRRNVLSPACKNTEKHRDASGTAPNSGNRAGTASENENYISKRYILHRIVKELNGCYLIFGDNTFIPEYVPKDDVIGIMTGLIHDGKQYDLHGLRYRLYLRFWIRPWRVRIRIVKMKHRLKRVWWKMVEILSPFIPRKIKDIIKRLLRM